MVNAALDNLQDESQWNAAAEQILWWPRWLTCSSVALAGVREE